MMHHLKYFVLGSVGIFAVGCKMSARSTFDDASSEAQLAQTNTRYICADNVIPRDDQLREKENLTISYGDKVVFLLKGKKGTGDLSEYNFANVQLKSGKTAWIASKYLNVSPCKNEPAGSAPGNSLKIPYLLQFGGNGECQITSVTMVRRYLMGKESTPRISELRPRMESFKSWVYIGNYFNDQGYKVVRHYNNQSGESDALAEDGMRKHLDDGAAIILHIFTRLGGHVVVLGGYDQTGWIVFDPSGHDFNRFAAGEYKDATTGEWRATKPDHVSFADMRLKGAYNAGVGRGSNVGYMYNAIFKSK